MKLRGIDMPLFNRGHRKSQLTEEEANSRSTDTGDAYWWWPPIEVVVAPAPKGMSDLYTEDECMGAVMNALDSFGGEYSDELQARMSAAWRAAINSSPEARDD